MFKAATTVLKDSYSRAAGVRLAELLVEKLGEPAAACWLFCSPQAGLEELLRGVSEALGCPNLVGCTADGEISEAGFSTGSAVLAGIATDRVQFHTTHIAGLGQDSEKAGRLLAEQLPSQVSYVQVFSDGLTGNGSALVRGMESVLGNRVPLAGGTAGDDGKFERTFQFHGAQILTDAVVGIGFSGPFSVATGVQSGWSPVGIAKKVTKASGNVVHELNSQSALEVYERFLGKHASKLPAVGVEYPLGLVDRHEDPGEEDFCLLRATMSVNREEGSIAFAGEIPENSWVRLTCGDHASILSAAASAAKAALENLGPVVPSVVFVFSCMARKIVLGRRTREESDMIRGILGKDVPILGFYTYGEYCPVKVGLRNLFHNETVTISAIGA